MAEQAGVVSLTLMGAAAVRALKCQREPRCGVLIVFSHVNLHALLRKYLGARSRLRNTDFSVCMRTLKMNN